MRCPDCDSLHLIPVRRTYTFRQGASWWARLMGAPDYASKRSGEVVTCARCLRQYLVTAEGVQRIRPGEAERVTESEPDERRERRKGASTPSDPDLAWRLEE